MKAVDTGTRVNLKSILFLTDFSQPSEAALPFAIAIAREFAATIHAQHVLIPQPYLYMTPQTIPVAIEAQEENAQAEMQRVEAQLTGVPHDVTVVRGVDIWSALEHAIARCSADLIVLGTHGRTGAEKLLLGSAAEEIFRQARIPVLTIGPAVRNGIHNAARFNRVLFATDFSAESLAATRFAVSLAEENQARLVLLHVICDLGSEPKLSPEAHSVANVMYRLYGLVPKDAELWCRPEAIVEYGEPAERILEAAKQRGADLIVMGVRHGRLGTATHLERSVAHKVVAHATCPVLTVRG